MLNLRYVEWSKINDSQYDMMMLLGAMEMKTLTTISKGLSGILLLSILMFYGGRGVEAESVEAQSTPDVSLESTATWWSDEWGRSQGIAWGDVDNDGDKHPGLPQRKILPTALLGAM